MRYNKCWLFGPKFGRKRITSRGWMLSCWYCGLAEEQDCLPCKNKLITRQKYPCQREHIASQSAFWSVSRYKRDCAILGDWALTGTWLPQTLPKAAWLRRTLRVLKRPPRSYQDFFTKVPWSSERFAPAPVPASWHPMMTHRSTSNRRQTLSSTTMSEHIFQLFARWGRINLGNAH